MILKKENISDTEYQQKKQTEYGTEELYSNYPRIAKRKK